MKSKMVHSLPDEGRSEVEYWGEDKTGYYPASGVRFDVGQLRDVKQGCCLANEGYSERRPFERSEWA